MQRRRWLENSRVDRNTESTPEPQHTDFVLASTSPTGLLTSLLIDVTFVYTYTDFALRCIWFVHMAWLYRWCVLSFVLGVAIHLWYLLKLPSCYHCRLLSASLMYIPNFQFHCAEHRGRFRFFSSRIILSSLTIPFVFRHMICINTFHIMCMIMLCVVQHYV